MTTEERLAKAEKAIKAMHIQQATAGLPWNPAYQEEDRQIILNHRIDQQLDKLNGKLIVDGGNIKLEHRDMPGIELVDDSHNKVEFSAILHNALQGLTSSKEQQSTTPDSNPFQKRAQQILQEERGNTGYKSEHQKAAQGRYHEMLSKLPYIPSK